MESDDKATALRFKQLAEQKYSQSNLKSALKYARRANRLQPDLDGVPEMVTAFKILRLASEPSSSSGSPNYYKILDVEPFSHINSIKKRYKMLALVLHPDKNSCLGAEEAFKHVGEAFRVLSDRVRRKEYDIKLRVALQTERSVKPVRPEDTFWTACSTCRLLHQFEKRYVGHRLICPSCRKSFLAVEVDDKDSYDGMQNGDGVGKEDSRTRVRSSSRPRVSTERKRDLNEEASRKRATTFSAPSRFSRARSSIREAKRRKHEMTLAEMQREAMRKIQLAKGKLKKKKSGEEKGKRKEEAEDKAVVVQNGDSICMLVEDSDFYEFDKDRTERGFKKGQVWAIYDDDDGMPRHYGWIEEVISVHPFAVRMKWLDVQNNGDESLLGWEKLGFHISCGRFKVGRELEVESVNMFSHVMDCERVAKEIYRIYPKKGSVWALYRSERSLEDSNLDSSEREGRSYDIVIFLTTYSELHGLSMAYLEKVEGFKTIFKRKEIGAHAITWFEKDDVRLFSHQIPAQKISGDEAPDLPKECWELDPASLPADLLRITDGS